MVTPAIFGRQLGYCLVKGSMLWVPAHRQRLSKITEKLWIIIIDYYYRGIPEIAAVTMQNTGPEQFTVGISARAATVGFCHT